MRAEYAPPEQAHDPVAQDVHCLVQCPAAPEHMWVQHHNGIFASSNEPDLYRDHRVEPSTFGFAVAVHPRDPDTAWFVPEIKDEKRIPREGKLVVTRTRDGGKSFDVLPAMACRSRMPMTWSTAMGWRSTTRASASPSARPQAACG